MASLSSVTRVSTPLSMIKVLPLSWAASSGTISLGGELTVHRLGFGAMGSTGDGTWGPPKNPAAATAVRRRAAEPGGNFIDTGDSYGPNVSEGLLAEPLAPDPKDLGIATQ